MTDQVVVRGPSANALASLANTANIEHAAFEATASAAVAHAIACGEALIEAKAQLRHGQWLSWLADHVEFNDRQAQRYMQIARNASRVSDLDSVRAALSELAEQRPKPPPPSEHRERMLEMSRRFDVVMAGRSPQEPSTKPSAKPYVPQGRDPQWRFDEALEAAQRVARHAKALEELGPPPVRHKRKAQGVLKELRAAADRIEKSLREGGANPAAEGQARAVEWVDTKRPGTAQTARARHQEVSPDATSE
jgi:hypothetical protein